MALETIFMYLAGGLIITFSGVTFTKLFTRGDAIKVIGSIVGTLALMTLLFFALNPEPVHNLLCELSNTTGARTTEGGSTSC